MTLRTCAQKFTLVLTGAERRVSHARPGGEDPHGASGYKLVFMLIRTFYTFCILRVLQIGFYDLETNSMIICPTCVCFFNYLFIYLLVFDNSDFSRPLDFARLICK